MYVSRVSIRVRGAYLVLFRAHVLLGRDLMVTNDNSKKMRKGVVQQARSGIGIWRGIDERHLYKESRGHARSMRDTT